MLKLEMMLMHFNLTILIQEFQTFKDNHFTQTLYYFLFVVLTKIQTLNQREQNLLKLV